MQIRGRMTTALLFVGGFCCLAPMGAHASTERAFELVSPLYKGGFGATFIEAVAQDGNGVAFFSPGEFAGAPAGLSNNANGLDYLARRTSSGWSTTPIMPPDQRAPYVSDHDISPDLSSTLALAKPGPSVEAASLEGSEDEFLLHATATPDIGVNWELDGIALKTLTNRPLTLVYEGASADFCHVLFATNDEGGELVKQAVGARIPLYELVRGCHGEPAEVRLVAVNGNGRPISPECPSEAGIFSYEGKMANEFNAITADGSEVFFTTCVKNNLFAYQVFIRLGGTKTLEVSRPVDPAIEQCEKQIPCPEAEKRASSNFAGASEDGSRAFFTTTARLDSGDKDSGMDLYMAEIGCLPSESGCAPASRHVTGLVRISRGSNGEEAGVQGVVKVAPDGSRAYFVASGDLLSPGAQTALEAEHRAAPHAGADNLYVYDITSKRMSFIGDLCSGYQRSGVVEDPRCPSKTGSDKFIWRETAEHEAQTAGIDGRYLVFSTYAQLTTDDADAAKDVYRYDAESGALQRVSLGEEGYSSNGNGAFDASINVNNLQARVMAKHELGSRAISEDGSRIIFKSEEALSPSAINHLTNVYEWHGTAGGGEGSVSLVSGGGGEFPVTDAVISPEGNDVFFVTTQGLVAQDTDGEADIYDARIGGGFEQPLAAREPCSSDACQGPLTNPAPLLVPGSATQASGENVAPPSKTVVRPKAKGKKRPKRTFKKKSKHRARRAARKHGRHGPIGGGWRS